MKRKISIFLLIAIFLLPIFTINTRFVDAQTHTCTASVYSVARSTPDKEVPADNTDKRIKIYIDTSGAQITDGTDVMLALKTPGSGNFIKLGVATLGFVPDEFVVSDNKVTIEIGTSQGNIAKIYEQGTFADGSYDLKVLPPSANPNFDDAYCTTLKAFTIGGSKTGSDNFCHITLDGDNKYNYGENQIKIKVDFPGDKDTGDDSYHSHRVKLKSKYELRDYDVTTNNLKEGWTIPNQLSGATYQILVREFNSGWNEADGRTCLSDFFLIDTAENGGGHVCTDENSSRCDTGGLFSNSPLSLPCSKAGPNYDKKIGCTRIHTALGYVDTQVDDFIRWVLGFVLGISGGIVLIIIIISGYRLMTSQGDPEKVKNARDQLTAAVVGLLFIIFSLVILQLITRDILQLPGFGQP